MVVLQHQSRGAEAFRRTGDGPEVAHVRDAIEHDEEKPFARLKALLDQFLERGEGDGGGEGDNALVVLLGDPVQPVLGNPLHGNSTGPQHGQEAPGPVVLAVPLDEHAGEVEAFVEGLEYGVPTDDPVVLLLGLGLIVFSLFPAASWRPWLPRGSGIRGNVPVRRR